MESDYEEEPALQTPPAAIIPAQERAGFGEIGEGELFRVPLELHAGQLLAGLHAQRDVPEQNNLGERPGPVEVRAGGRSPLAGRHPFLVIAGIVRE